jgi:hypothetical protein
LPKKVSGPVEVLELDELHTFIGSKKLLLGVELQLRATGRGSFLLSVETGKANQNKDLKQDKRNGGLILIALIIGRVMGELIFSRETYPNKSANLYPRGMTVELGIIWQDLNG